MDVATIPVGSGPLGVAYDSAKGEIFVTNIAEGTVSVISDVSNTVVATIPVGSGPYGVAYDSAKGEIFVANNAEGTVSVISDVSNTVIATISVGLHPNPPPSPIGVAYDSAKGEIFVAIGAEGTISVISDVSNTVVATIPVGSGPYGVAYDSAKGEIFVSNNGASTVSVISDVSNTVVATISVGLTPYNVAYDSAKGEIFVANNAEGTVSVISDVSNTVVATISVGSGPGPAPIDLAYDSTNGQIFATNSAQGTVSVISDVSNTVIATISVGSGPSPSPYNVAYDSAKGEIFVANNAEGTVSVISDTVSSTTLISIAIQHPATKLSYTVGDRSNVTDGLVVTGTYSNATTRIVTPDIVTGFDSSVPANNEVITIHVGTQTTFYTIDVVAQVIQINLGTANTFGILANTYANTATGVGIIGYVGYAIPPTLVPTISGSTYASPNPVYLQAGADQDTALNALNTLNVLTCDYTFGTATDLSLLPQPLTPGVYCITGAQSVGAGGIILNGVGTFVFRSTGTLNTNANSHVTLLGGANASNIFWTPVATTLGANSIFVGTDIDNSGITIGDNVRWLGRALDFATTVTTGTGVQITVPAVDVTNPITTITSPADNTFSNSVSVNLSGVSSDVNLDVTTISVDGGPFVTTSGTAFSWTFFATGLSEGLHTFQTRATDAGGNAGLSSIIHVTINAVVNSTNSTSIASATGVGQINSITSSGNFTSFVPVSESSLTTSGKPATEQFPFGFFSFHIVGLTPGQTIHVTQTYPSTLPAGTNYWKIDNGVWTNETSLISINGNTLTLTLTDGGPEDSDHAVNGEITDPGGPGIPFVPSVLTPTSSDVTIYHPPSLGNDYYHPYSDGLKISSVGANGLEFNGKTFDIAKYGSTVPQQVLQIGESANFTFKIYDERGANTLSHVGMYMHFMGDTSVANSDTSIVWDKHDGVKVTDPEKFFSNATMSERYDGNFAYVSIKFTPAKIMPDSSILMRMWDDKLSSIDLPINGAIIIVDPNAPIPVKQIPSNQYGDYNTLVSLLDSDGYQMPSILHRIKSGSDLATTVDVYWIYDKGADKLIMVETFKDGTIIGDTGFNLIKKLAEPTLTDHDYVDMPAQNNRQNPEQEKAVMLQEEIKAEKILDAMNLGVRKAS